MTVAGESPVEYTYDENGRLTGVTHGDIGTALMEYDDAGRRVLLTLPNGTATSYAYDASSRLLALTHAGASGTIEKPTYTYDAAGNRVSLTTLNPQAELPAVVTAAVDAANRLLSHNEENLTYDANGNLLAGTDASGTTTYTWDARNRLVAMEGPSVTASFKYDAFNRRTEKTVNDKRTQYLYDGVDIIAEVEDGIITAKYLRSLSIDEVFARMDSTGMRYYHKDGLGSTVALTDSSGHVTTRYTYGPFGETTAAGDADANPFQYTGREWDQETGLYYYRARYYDPMWGRFISEDPIRFAGGDVNLYAYVQSNAINRIDPAGLCAEDACIGEMLLWGIGSYMVGQAVDYALKAKPKEKCDDTEKPPETCASKHPGIPLCSTLDPAYRYGSQNEALNALKNQTGLSNLKIVSKNVTTGGPAPGLGMHLGVKSGGNYIGSIMSCPCCEETPAGPVVRTQWSVY